MAIQALTTTLCAIWLRHGLRYNITHMYAYGRL